VEDKKIYDPKGDDARIGVYFGMAFGLVTWLLCRHFGLGFYARAAFSTAWAVFFSIWIHWDLSTKLWFWEAMLGLTALHVPLTMVIAKAIEHSDYSRLNGDLFVLDWLLISVAIHFLRPPEERPNKKKPGR